MIYSLWFIFPNTEYKNEIGFTGQLLIEPKPKEPTRHQYDYGRLKIFIYWVPPPQKKKKANRQIFYNLQFKNVGFIK